MKNKIIKIILGSQFAIGFYDQLGFITPDLSAGQFYILSVKSGLNIVNGKFIEASFEGSIHKRME